MKILVNFLKDKNYSFFLPTASTLSLLIIFVFVMLRGINFFTYKNVDYHSDSIPNSAEKSKLLPARDDILPSKKMNLDVLSIESQGRTNPFLPPAALPGQVVSPGQVPGTPGAYQIPSPTVTQPQVLFPSQLPPLPDQIKPEKLPTVEVPAWPTHSPVLTAGPPERLASMLKLRVTGILHSGKDKFAVVEETVENYNPATGSTGQEVRSYVVREGYVITEYELHIKNIEKNMVQLKRGNQKINLYLKEQPRTFTAPPPASAAQDKSPDTPPASQAK